MNKENKIKKVNYEILFERVKVAKDNEFFLEVAWISYSILEDRLTSLLEKTGGVPIEKNPLMFGKKLTHIENRSKTDQNLKNILYDDLVKKLRTWSQERNILMHVLADCKKPIVGLDVSIKNTATQGEILARELSARVRKIKKKSKKIKI